jgi:hypothetical protein
MQCIEGVKEYAQCKTRYLDVTEDGYNEWTFWMRKSSNAFR